MPDLIPHTSNDGVAPSDLSGRAFEYALLGYRLRMEFIAEERLRWTRLEAPDTTTGQSNEEICSQTMLRPNLFLVAFTEADGNVVDVFDIAQSRVFVSYVTNDNEMSQAVVTMTEVTHGAS